MRACGPCAACCSILQVPELAKPAFSPCAHRRGEAGCSIYLARPPSCRGFECLWLRGRVPGGEETRPDKLGIMFSPVTAAAPGGVSAEAVGAWEAWPGAADEPAGKVFLAGLSSHPIVLIRDDRAPKITGELLPLRRAGAN